MHDEETGRRGARVVFLVYQRLVRETQSRLRRGDAIRGPVAPHLLPGRSGRTDRPESGHVRRRSIDDEDELEPGQIRSLGAVACARRVDEFRVAVGLRSGSVSRLWKPQFPAVWPGGCTGQVRFAQVA